jgi:chromosomal replication initiation ATPase DnaA
MTRALPEQVQAIVRTVACSHGLTPDTLLSGSRERRVVAALRVVYVRLSDIAEPPQIAAWMNRDLTSVHKGIKHMRALASARVDREQGKTVVYLSLWHGKVTAPVGRMTMKEIATNTARLYGLTVENIRGRDRDRYTCLARDHAAWTMAQQPHLSLVQIGRWLGGRDHSSIIHAAANHEARMGEKEAA